MDLQELSGCFSLDEGEATASCCVLCAAFASHCVICVSRAEKVGHIPAAQCARAQLCALVKSQVELWSNIPEAAGDHVHNPPVRRTNDDDLKAKSPTASFQRSDESTISTLLLAPSLVSSPLF